MKERINNYLEESNTWRDEALEETLEDINAVREDPTKILDGAEAAGAAIVDAFEYFTKHPDYNSIGQYSEAKRGENN